MTAAPILPFIAGAKVAVVGPHTNDNTAILGNYLGQICADSFSSRTCVQTTYEAIALVNGPSTSNATGVRVNSTDATGIAAALTAASAADSIVYVGGLDVASVEKEGKDRYDVGLPGLQPKLLEKLLALGKPTAVVPPPPTPPLHPNPHSTLLL